MPSVRRFFQVAYLRGLSRPHRCTSCKIRPQFRFLLRIVLPGIQFCSSKITTMTHFAAVGNFCGHQSHNILLLSFSSLFSCKNSPQMQGIQGSSPYKAYSQYVCYMHTKPYKYTGLKLLNLKIVLTKSLFPFSLFRHEEVYISNHITH